MASAASSNDVVVSRSVIVNRVFSEERIRWMYDFSFVFRLFLRLSNGGEKEGERE